jgi:hypothetical protein
MAKHANYDPEDKWRCPVCGAADEFIIEYRDEKAHSECDRLHNKDLCICDACGWSGTGATVSRRLAALDKMTECPCCKGRGMVPDERENR